MNHDRNPEHAPLESGSVSVRSYLVARASFTRGTGLNRRVRALASLSQKLSPLVIDDAAAVGDMSRSRVGRFSRWAPGPLPTNLEV